MDETFVNNLATALRKVGTIHTVGEEWHSYTGEIPVGGVPYCGQMVTRATYSALWKYAQEKYLVLDEANWQMYAQANGGNVPFYSSGDGSTTFRMPRIVGYVKGASSQSEAGMHLFEGLPNVEGSISGMWTRLGSNNATSTGAISHTATSSSWVGQSSQGGYELNSLSIDASNSNAIYGNSDHVTPETSVVMFGVYAFGAIVETGALDATTLATGLARLEANMPVTPSAYIVEKWSNGTNWYRKYSDGWIEQGGSFASSGVTSGTTTLNTPFANANYQVLFGLEGGNGGYNSDTSMDIAVTKESKTLTSFGWNYGGHGASPTIKAGFHSWYACGY